MVLDDHQESNSGSLAFSKNALCFHMTLTNDIWMKRDAAIVRCFTERSRITLTHITKNGGYRGTKHSQHLEEITDITPRMLSVYVFLRTWKQN